MKCKEVQEELALFLGGQLSGERARDFRKHLASCSSCSSALGTSDRIEALTAMDEVVEPAPDLHERFRARLHSHRQNRHEAIRAVRWRDLWQPRRLAALGAVAAVLIAGFYVVTINRETPEINLGSDLSTVDPVSLLQDMEIIQNLELLEDFDAIEVLAENGNSLSTIQ